MFGILPFGSLRLYRFAIMSENVMSRTAIWAAACRALGSLEPDPRVRNPDSLATTLIGPDEVALLGDSALAGVWSLSYDELSRNSELINSAHMMTARTRFIDDTLLASIHNGAKQVVILGAGFDSRAYRFSELLQNISVFEIDHPATQEAKKARVRAALGSLPPNITYVPIDFRDAGLDGLLAAASYKKNEITFFNWEGVTMYLPAKDVTNILQWVASNSAPGSTIVFDYTYASVIRLLGDIDLTRLPEKTRVILTRFQTLTQNELWGFGLPDR